MIVGIFGNKRSERIELLKSLREGENVLIEFYRQGATLKDEQDAFESILDLNIPLYLDEFTDKRKLLTILKRAKSSIFFSSSLISEQILSYCDYAYIGKTMNKTKLSDFFGNIDPKDGEFVLRKLKASKG